MEIEKSMIPALELMLERARLEQELFGRMGSEEGLNLFKASLAAADKALTAEIEHRECQLACANGIMDCKACEAKADAFEAAKMAAKDAETAQTNHNAEVESRLKAVERQLKRLEIEAMRPILEQLATVLLGGIAGNGDGRNPNLFDFEDMP